MDTVDLWSNVIAMCAEKFRLVESEVKISTDLAARCFPKETKLRQRGLKSFDE